MIKCNDCFCPVFKDNRCCFGCPQKETCGSDACDQEPKSCGYSEGEATDLEVFQNKALATMQAIADLNLQKQRLDAQDKDLRKQLQEFMDQYGVKKFENDLVKITYVEPTTRTSIDSTRLKKELPDIAKQYSKVSQIKGSVRIEVK